MSEWLIDIIKEWVQGQDYLQTSYVDRGDPAAIDFGWLNHNFWPNIPFDIDLSGIVPVNAKAVHLRLWIINAAILRWILFRKKGNANWVNANYTRIQVAGLEIDTDVIVAVDETRIVEVDLNVGIWAEVSILVAGWWL